MFESRMPSPIGDGISIEEIEIYRIGQNPFTGISSIRLTMEGRLMKEEPLALCTRSEPLLRCTDLGYLDIYPLGCFSGSTTTVPADGGLYPDAKLVKCRIARDSALYSLA